MRERVEDLGRIAVLVDNLLENELFEEKGKYRPYRPKDVHEWFKDKTEEEKADFINSVAYGIERIEHEILQIRDIARGQDLLNLEDLDEGPRFSSQLFP